MTLSPVIQRDGWHYVYTGQKWIEEGISFGDLLEKRQFTDQSLPIVKILLYFNLKFFSLDFRMEGLLGFLALVGIVLFGYFIHEKNEYNIKNWISAVWICSGSLVLLSPIEPETYYWSLSMFGYMFPLLGIVCSFLLWGYLKNKKGSSWFLFLTLLILFMCGDVVSLIISSALSIPIILMNTKMSDFWTNRRKIISLITLFLFTLLYFFLVNFKYLKGGSYNSQNLNGVSLWSNFATNISNIDTYKFLFVRGIVGSNYSELKFINYINFFTILLILLLLVYFIFRIIKNRGLQTFRDFVLLYLFSYFIFSIFLILIGRSSIDAPRYTPVFQLLPLVLLWTPAFVSQPISNGNQILRTILGIFIFVALSTNYGYNTYKAFTGVIYQKAWEKRVTEIIAEVFEDRYDSKDCISPHGRGICDMSNDQQKYILDFLYKQKLNIFNPRLQSIYGLQPFTGGLKANKILNWGPQGFVLGGEIPNVNAEGNIGLYFQMSNSFGLDGIDLQIGEAVIPTVSNENGLLTAYFDVKGIANPKNIMVSLIDKKQNLILTVGEFRVLKN